MDNTLRNWVSKEQILKNSFAHSFLRLISNWAAGTFADKILWISSYERKITCLCASYHFFPKENSMTSENRSKHRLVRPFKFRQAGLSLHKCPTISTFTERRKIKLYILNYLKKRKKKNLCRTVAEHGRVEPKQANSKREEKSQFSPWRRTFHHLISNEPVHTWRFSTFPLPKCAKLLTPRCQNFGDEA